MDRLGQPTSVHNSEGGTCFKNTVRLVFYGVFCGGPQSFALLVSFPGLFGAMLWVGL